MSIYTMSLVGLCVAAATAGAQGRDPREVQPERPTVATHAGTVAPGYLELEWGGEFAGGATFPLYFKLGSGSRTQIGLAVPLTPNNGALDVGPLQVALKWRVADNAGFLGDFAIQPSVSFPVGTGPGNGVVAVLLISSHQFGALSMDINAGVTAARGAGMSELWTFSVGGPMSGNWGWVGELSGTATSGSSQMSFLAGPTYRLRSSFALDAGVIAPVNPTGDLRFYVGGVTNLGRIFGK